MPNQCRTTCYRLCHRWPGDVVGKGGDYGVFIQGRVFLRSRSSGSFGRAASNGILPLSFLPILVRRSGQCLHAVEAWRRAGHCRCGTCCHVPKDSSQSATILQDLRWPSYGQSSSTGIGGRICGDIAVVEVRAWRPRELCRNGPAHARRPPKAKGFSAAQAKWCRSKRRSIVHHSFGTTRRSAGAFPGVPTAGCRRHGSREEYDAAHGRAFEGVGGGDNATVWSNRRV